MIESTQKKIRLFRIAKIKKKLMIRFKAILMNYK